MKEPFNKQHLNLLLIEDNPGDAFLIEEYVSDSILHSISVDWIDCLKAAKNKLSTNQAYDIILMDLNLPDAHGISTFEQINSIVPNIPIIALTGLDDDVIIRDIISSGAQDYLIKGNVDTEKLDRAIRYAIDRKKVEQRLRASEKRFRVLIEKNPYAVLVVNRYGKIIFANPAFEELFNRTNDECKDFVFGIPSNINNTTEITIIGKDGRHVTAEMRAVETFYQGLNAYILLFYDITKRHHLEKNLKQTAFQLNETLVQLKKSQAQLIESEKLRALGTLTAGVAHELNNPMTGIIQYVQYCIQHTEKSNKVYSVLLDIEQETKRCVNIVDSLLTFSRQGHQNKALEDVNVHTIIDRVLHLLTYRIEKENIQVIFEKNVIIPDIKLHVSSVQQVFMNLFANAIDALKGFENKTIRILTFIESAHVIIQVIDNGCGIDPGNETLLFDPFFTSKPVGQGTGLGLSICKSIIENHNGNIFIDNNDSEGTTIIIKLPIKETK